MANFADLFSYIYQYFDNIGFLILASLGLILIFGMMGVINMAHGELMMIGAYITAYAYHPACHPDSDLLAGIGAGLMGMVLERLIVRHFYNQLLSPSVVTWGLSLMLSQGFLLIFGPSVLNVPTPFGGFAVGNLSFGVYRLVLFSVSLGLVASYGRLFQYMRLAIYARATMENAEMAEALGIKTARIYSLTFGLGAALGGIAGGDVRTHRGDFALLRVRIHTSRLHNSSNRWQRKRDHRVAFKRIYLAGVQTAATKFSTSISATF